MSSLLPRLTAVLVGAAVVLVPSAALAAGPGEAPAGRAAQGPAAQAGPAALPSPAAAARGAGTGAVTGAAAGRSAVQGPAARPEPAVAPSGPRTAAAPGRQGPARNTGPASSKGAAGQAGTPAPARSGKAAPGKAAPGKAAPGKAAPGKAAPGKAAPGKAAPAKAAPAKGLSNQPAPGARPEPARQAAPAAEPAARVTAPARPSGDPRGNNGTFKVDGPVLDTSRGNEPQVDCAFRLNFYGYDAGQLANIVFTPIAPTPGASTTVSGRQLISTDAAKGGLYNGSYPTAGTWTAADLGLDPTVRQHVKVSVESLNADGSDVPGGAKHKVFWLHPCGTVQAAALPAGAAPAGSVLPVVGTRTLPAARPAVGAVPSMGPSTQVLGTTAPVATRITTLSTANSTVVAAPVTLGGGVLAAAAAAPATAAAGTAAPAALPFTGPPQLLALLVGGLISLLGGTALVAAARTSA